MMSEIKYDYHMHTKYCDGRGEPEDFIINALEKDLKIIGFTSHSPVPFETDWTMPEKKLPEYLKTINKLKIKYKDKIKILLGLEVDYIPGVFSCKSSIIKNAGLDYTIGSVHFLGEMKDGFKWTADGSFDETNKGINYTFKGSGRNAVEAYYNRMIEMVVTSPPDIIGHFDLIKVNNRDNCFFSEKEGWYNNIIDKTLDVISQSKCVVEVNTGGITRNKINTLYPSTWILERCFDKNIPLIINSDSHSPEQLACNFETAIAEVKKAGYKKLAYFTGMGRGEYNL